MTNQDLKPLITKVQTLRRQVAGLGEDGVWRAFLSRCVGITSTRAMSMAQLSAVIEALHQAGALRLPPAAGKPRFAQSAQMAKIRGLWLQLADMGEVRDRSEAALAAFVRRQCGQDMGKLTAHSAKSVIEALKSWHQRVEEKGKKAAL